MPAIAAIDNETLDHLLSVVDDARNLPAAGTLSKRGRGGEEAAHDERRRTDLRVGKCSQPKPDASGFSRRKVP